MNYDVKGILWLVVFVIVVSSVLALAMILLQHALEDPQTEFCQSKSMTYTRNYGDFCIDQKGNLYRLLKTNGSYILYKEGEAQ